ncbi:MAG: Ig-like domain-containing protein [Propionibacteriaceae bacterium]|nr:Ig-like domain-containing protein [Propionibacteriaceae bacterium]
MLSGLQRLGRDRHAGLAVGEGGGHRGGSRLQVRKSTKAIKALGLDDGDSIAGWSSSDPGIATVDAEGRITAKKKTGKVTITATTERGATASVVITVTKSKVKTTSIKANVQRLTLEHGDTFQLEITRNPITATEKISYKSSKKTVATVSSKGEISAKKPGTATITVKTSNKKSVKVKVTFQ